MIIKRQKNGLSALIIALLNKHKKAREGGRGRRLFR